MDILWRVLGLALLVFGIYLVGQNIIFTTNVYPYLWRGIAADASILTLTAGMLMLVFLPRRERHLGWIAVAIGILLVLISSKAILAPTSLWQFLLSLASMGFGYRMLVTGRFPLD